MSKIFSKYITHHPKTILLIFFTILLFSIFNLNKFKLDASSDSLVLESDDDLKYVQEEFSAFCKNQQLKQAYF